MKTGMNGAMECLHGFTYRYGTGDGDCGLVRFGRMSEKTVRLEVVELKWD